MIARLFGVVTVSVVLTACSILHSKVAEEAQVDMVGMPKEQVLACMGLPAKTSTVGQTEVWAYTTVGPFALQDCTVNVVMTGGRVTVVNYTGNAGGPLSPASQCYRSVSNCVPKQ